MAVTPQSIVGVVSNPDDRPVNGSATLTAPSKWADPNQRNVTFNISGRVARVFPRDNDPYAAKAVT